MTDTGIGKKNSSSVRIAQTDWSGQVAFSPQLRSVFFDDIYFAGNGLAETRHVFLAGNNLARRFSGSGAFTIAETGFGTGLNFLAAADLWRKTRTPANIAARAHLHFISYEQFPLAPGDLARAHSAWPELAVLADALQRAYPPIASGFHRLSIAPDITLTLAFGEAGAMMANTQAHVDAWFLDGFAPSKNPDMWRPEIFEQAARLSAPGATFATFTVAGDVRRAAEAAGFTLTRKPGFGRKREMLAGVLSDARKTKPDRKPWFTTDGLEPHKPGAHVAVIGGGVAGAAAAHTLIRQNFRVTNIDPNGLASGASGNIGGLIMPRLDMDDAPPARFFRAAYLHALRTIDALQAETGETFFNPCGVLLQADDDDARVKHERLLAMQALPPDYMQRHEHGLFFPQGGVIGPARYVKALARGAMLCKARALSIESGDDRCRVHLDSGEHIDADAVVIANAREALRFFQMRSLPFSFKAGQLDHFPEVAASEHAIVAGRYIAPAPSFGENGSGVLLGASYHAVSAEEDAATSSQDTADNLTHAPLTTELREHLSNAMSRPRASIRCHTLDHQPVAGPVPHWALYCGRFFDPLRQGRLIDGRKAEYAPEYAPGVFTITGLGSRGLVTAPLLGELVAAHLTGAPLPVETDIAEALHPARFFVRDARRARSILASGFDS
jgi:tRNA 5-methylaminomethyl-2-thiouridine biosynthesis bifunctional protein